MSNRIDVNVAGHSYSLLVEEDEPYVRRVAEYADKLLTEQKRTVIRSETDAAVIALLNACDEYFKLLEDAELLRTQVNDYRDELTAARAEISELKRHLTE